MTDHLATGALPDSEPIGFPVSVPITILGRWDEWHLRLQQVFLGQEDTEIKPPASVIHGLASHTGVAGPPGRELVPAEIPPERAHGPPARPER
jgi:hypothetical protein